MKPTHIHADDFFTSSSSRSRAHFPPSTQSFPRAFRSLVLLSEADRLGKSEILNFYISLRVVYEAHTEYIQPSPSLPNTAANIIHQIYFIDA